MIRYNKASVHLPHTGEITLYEPVLSQDNIYLWIESLTCVIKLYLPVSTVETDDSITIVKNEVTIKLWNSKT